MAPGCVRTFRGFFFTAPPTFNANAFRRQFDIVGRSGKRRFFECVLAFSFLIVFGTLHAAEDPPKPLVIFLHGLASNPLSMEPIARVFRKAGYETLRPAYPSTQSNLAALADWLRVTMEPHTHRDLIFVTHSLGGIILRAWVQKNPPHSIKACILIAPPNHGSPLADFAVKVTPLEKIFGPVLHELKASSNQILENLPPPPAPFGIIAGRIPAAAGPPGDGTVPLESAKLAGMKDFLIVPAEHNAITLDPAVARAALRFAQTGSF